jgi:hypothetical protein
MNAFGFVDALKLLKFENTFNPYECRCHIYDKLHAPNTRANLLAQILEAAINHGVESIWVGRDLGYRGGRRTGLAFTDDVHVAMHAKRWGINAERFTKGTPIAERTAAVIWNRLSNINAPIFLWNAFPLHPHEPNEPFSNRQHNAKEAATGEDVLRQLVYLLQPKYMVAIGNDAYKTLSKIDRTCHVVRVRHPSYGGQREFERQIDNLYRKSRLTSKSYAHQLLKAKSNQKGVD